MARFARKVVITGAIVLATVVGGGLAYDFIALRRTVLVLRSHLSEMPAEGSEMLPSLDRAIPCADPYWERRLVDYAAFDSGRSMRPAARVFRTLVWRALLPIHFDRKERLTLYAYYMPMEGGRGLAYGAREYFGKRAADLSADEQLGLVAIAKHPSMNSPKRNPQRYQIERDALITRCGSQ
jgi:transglycosylase-like protein